MTGPTFRIKPYAHPKYKFVVRAKLAGKWKRSYFKSEAEAVAYAGNQNASLEKQVKRQRSGRMRSNWHTNRTRNWYELEKSNRRPTVSSQAVPRKAIVVLGMHRSGTSALCGALDVLGVNFGERLAPATKDNKKGHWEHFEIVALHDELLRSLGSRWDNDRPLPSDWATRDITQDVRSLLIGILERDFARTSLFGLKDPRMCRLMPLWLPIFQTLRIEPHFVLMVRHPWEVAESLAKRDGLEHPKSYLLWLEHFVQAISATRAHQQSVVCYEEMIDDPVKVLSRLRKEFGVNLRAPSRLRASLRKFLEPSLRHHHRKNGQANKHKPPVPYLALDLYETIRNASTSVEIGEKTAPLVAQFGRGSELFYPRVNLLEAELGSLDQKIAKSEKADMDSEGLVRLEIFHPVAEGYRAEESQTRYFASGCWKLLIIDLPGRERNLDRPFRIDPVSYPAVIDIAEIALKRPSTSEILWAATGSKEFDALTVGGTACRLAHESYLRILSFGNDPQLLLPQSTTALADSPLRLELSILVDESPQAISASLAEMQTERSQIEEELERVSSAFHRSEGELKQRDATIAANNAEIERERTEYQSQMQASAARHEKERAEHQSQIRQFAAKLQDSQSETEKIREHFVQTNQLLHAKSISLAEGEARATELTARLRQKLHDLKKLTRLLGSLEEVAMRLRSSRRWKLANPMVSLRSKFLRRSEPAGYDHLDKVVAAYRRWRIAHPEVDDLDEQIQRLHRQAALKDSTTELPTSAETLPPAEVSSASDRTDTVAPVAPKPIEFPVFDKVEVNSIQSEHPDVAAANVEPLTHFESRGRTEGRKTTEETISFEAYRPAFDIPREPTVSADPSLVPTEAASSRRDAAGKSDEPYVLVISHDAALAGAQVLLLSLLRQWKKRHPFAVRIICVGAGELRKEFEKCFPTLVLADFAAKAEQDYALAEFLRGSPRVIYSSTVVNGPLLAQLRPLGAKIVTHTHELQKSIERWAPGEIMAATLKHSDFFLAASPKIAENLSISHGVLKDNLHVVYAFIEPWVEEQEPTAAAKAAMQEELGIGVEDVVVFGCGTTDWRKGPDLFVEIARSACARDSRLKFLWIGGDPAPFMEKVRSAGLEGRVFFVGHRKEARRYYYAGHIFLLSSREDPCPLVALEAANAGLPIVCFADAGDIPGFVGEECGVVVPYEDVPAAARAVLRLAGDAELRRNQGAEGRRRVVERHSSDSAALQIEALFDRLAPELQPASTRAKSREEEPLVSVIVPNYNHEKYLPERLRSITGQTYENMEIILLDDASTDNSRAILQKFASNENRARFVPNKQNSGSTFKQWRKGLSEARGKYVWFAESDDTAEPAFLETLVGKLEANPGLSLAYCQLQMVSPNGEKLGTPEQPWLSEIDPLRWNTDFVNDGIDEIRRSLLVKNTILNASSVVFRNAEGFADLVDDSMRFCADWLFWVRLLQRGGVAYVAKPLSRWRLQSSNARKRPAGELEWLEGERVLLEAAEILKMTPSERDRILLDFLRKCWKWRLEAVS